MRSTLEKRPHVKENATKSKKRNDQVRNLKIGELSIRVSFLEHVKPTSFLKYVVVVVRRKVVLATSLLAFLMNRGIVLGFYAE